MHGVLFEVVSQELLSLLVLSAFTLLLERLSKGVHAGIALRIIPLIITITDHLSIFSVHARG